jgi:phosphatidate phosphatase APP1
MVKGDTEPLANKKFENFCEYLTLYPEFSCIFIGDNGQGDVRTAEMILNDVRYRDNLQRVYIHEIQPLYLTYAKNQMSKSRESDRICYFNTYVDAAIDAHKYVLIRSSGLRRYEK